MGSALRDPAAAVDRALACARDPARVAVVRRTGLLDAGIQESLQRYARLASELSQAPISAVNIIDAARQYQAAFHGFEVREAPLEASICKHVVADGAQLRVSDVSDDVLLSEHPAAQLGVRAYLGSPISASGSRVGALCVVDVVAHDWDERTCRIVDDLAAAVSAEVELRVREAMEREAAHTDALTGLGNRRALAAAIAEAQVLDGPVLLGLFDLDGFKAYNDAFGHPAGDDLLVRLGQRLARAIEPRGAAFRMGGDEFCVLVDTPTHLERAREALAEQGPAFHITASLGSVALGAETADPTAAIGLADRRLYTAKRSRPGSIDDQLASALAVALAERDGELGGHCDSVAALARCTAESLGLGVDEVQQASIAARLHDIGKMALPERLLGKPGPLDEDEWALMRRHTLIGERILAAAPALSRTASLVRSCHERFDGGGYPDGLSGERIPLGARIVFACDAYDTMTSDRVYCPKLTEEEARDEMQRCAGTQFDPRVVSALLKVLGAPSAQQSSLV